MSSNRMPLYIIGGVVVLMVVAVIIYAMSQNSAAPAQDAHHDTSETEQDDESPAVKTDQVTIENYSFSPATITVKVGTTVTWINQDSIEHTVTTEDGAPAKIDSGLFGKGESFNFTFDTAGTYQYFCEPHPYMKGTVIVTE